MADIKPKIIDGEADIARQTEAGREMLRVLNEVRRKQTGEQRIAKAFELTEMTRQTMRAGLRQQNPDLTEEEFQRLYVNRLLSFHGLSLEKIERMREDDTRQLNQR